MELLKSVMKSGLCYLVLLCCLTSCSYHPFISAEDMVNAESPSTVGKNRIGASAAGSTGDGSAFTQSWISGNVKVTYGLLERVEMELAGFGLNFKSVLMCFGHNGKLFRNRSK